MNINLNTYKKMPDRGKHSILSGRLLYLGFITNPKNGEVKALSVQVP